MEDVLDLSMEPCFEGSEYWLSVGRIEVLLGLRIVEN